MKFHRTTSASGMSTLTATSIIRSPSRETWTSLLVKRLSSTSSAKLRINMCKTLNLSILQTLTGKGFNSNKLSSLLSMRWTNREQADIKLLWWTSSNRKGSNLEAPQRLLWPWYWWWCFFAVFARRASQLFFASVASIAHDSFKLHSNKPPPLLVESQWTWWKKELTQKPAFVTKDLQLFVPVLIHSLMMLKAAKPESRREKR